MSRTTRNARRRARRREAVRVAAYGDTPNPTYWRCPECLAAAGTSCVGLVGTHEPRIKVATIASARRTPADPSATGAPATPPPSLPAPEHHPGVEHRSARLAR